MSGLMTTGYTCPWCDTRRAMNIYGAPPRRPAASDDRTIECWSCGARLLWTQFVTMAVEASMRRPRVITAPRQVAA